MRIPEERIVPPGTRVNRRCLTKMFPVRFSAYGHTYPSNRAGLRADRSLWTWSKERAQFKSLNTEYTEKSGERRRKAKQGKALAGDLNPKAKALFFSAFLCVLCVKALELQPSRRAPDFM
jgi:hypothetical protein